MTVAIRPATGDDADLLLAWANDPATRAAGFHPEPIDDGVHRRWLTDRLASPSTRTFVGLEDGRPIGQVRLDRDADGQVEIGISVAPDARGRGIGRALLRAALASARHDATLAPTAFVARIRPENVASIALFAGAGFRSLATIVIDGSPCLVYRAEV